MTTVDTDAAFREALLAGYQTHDLGRADYIIHLFSQAPEETLTSVERCRTLLFGLELWAACFDHPHAAIAHVERARSRMWRYATTPEQTVQVLAWLSESPFGAEFAEDVSQLRPRLVTVAQASTPRPSVPSTPST